MSNENQEVTEEVTTDVQDTYIQEENITAENVDPALEWAETTEVTEIAPDTVKSDEDIAEEMKNPKHEAFKANYKNKFPEPKESKKYWFTFDSWDEYYHKRAKAIKELPKEETE